MRRSSNKQEIHIGELIPPVPARHLKSIGELAANGMDSWNLADAVDTIASSPHHHLIVAKLSGRIVGLTMITENELTQGVYMEPEIVSRDKDLEGKGIGRLLVGYVANFADEKGFHVQVVNNKKDSLAALRYKSSGFKERKDDKEVFIRKPRRRAGNL